MRRFLAIIGVAAALIVPLSAPYVALALTMPPVQETEVQAKKIVNCKPASPGQPSPCAPIAPID